ncbi:MAG TPA: hypothetical protein PLG59_19980 [bacterium]|nr:hypothetical protein [bacterium]
MRESYSPKQFQIPWPYTGAIFGPEEEEVVSRMIRDAATKRRPLDRRSPEIVEFENQFATYIGAEYGVASVREVRRWKWQPESSESGQGMRCSSLR